ncbi:MAG TPA: glycosyltransferase family 2 protein, partial [Geobacteraceae bacterium]
MGPRLSICIPTYNRAGLLRETLESIVGQARDGLEIVVCDNASTDATPQLVEAFRERFPAIHYFRWPENMGFDRNILKTVEEAHGDYCWLMGDDDHLEKGALERLFPLLEEGYG